jgi:hypothetical protein
MKKQYLFCVICLFPCLLCGQIEKGQKFLLGSLQYNVTDIVAKVGANEEEFNNNFFSLNLSGGLFTTERSALTLGIGFGGYRNSGLNESYTPIGQIPDGEFIYSRRLEERQDVQRRFSLGFGLRRYFPLKERFYAIVGGDLFGTSTRFERTRTPMGQNPEVTASNSLNFSLQLRPGLAYFLNRRFGIETFFGGVFVNYSPGSKENPDSSIYASFANSGVIAIGITYFLY